jgi:imidazole glycerol-phosphate synthase subunit HisH
MTTINKEIAIIDLEIGNIGSVFRALKKIGSNPIICQKKSDFFSASKIILPGVGSFNYGMSKLIEKNLYEPLLDSVINKQIPFLGICLGMQMLATKGFENNVETMGLNLIGGDVNKIRSNNKIKLPHMGWNEVDQSKKVKLFENIKNNKDFYFVHSYAFNPKDKSTISSYSTYGEKFVSSIEKNNIYGVQFHPEKSLDDGITLLKNFLVC